MNFGIAESKYKFKFHTFVETGVLRLY